MTSSAGPSARPAADEVIVAMVHGRARHRTEPTDTDRVRQVLREHGLRYSRPREAILGYLTEEDRHVSAEGLHQALRERGEDLSLSTVYLNLGVLARAGLLREFTGAAGETLYDSNVTPHYHLICSDTGEVIDITAPQVGGMPLGAFLKDYIERTTGWEVEEPRLTLRGRAPDRRRAAIAAKRRDGSD
jgi:Fur family transcriptional regulator, peroxide stress response regulator